MKILKVIFFGLLGLIVLIVLGLFVFIKTFNVNHYLPQITRQIGTAVNRKVTIGHAGLDFDLSGLSLDVRNIAVSDDPRFGRNHFLQLREAQLRLDVMALLLKRQIHITRILLDSPKISIVRLADGTLNVQTMAPVSLPQGANSSGDKVAAANAASNPAMAMAGLLTIGSVSISHAQFSFEDQNPQMPLHVFIPNAEIDINHFSLTGPFDFTASVDAWGRKQDNINISGHGRLDLAKSAIHISGLQIKSDLSQWDWNALRKVTPLLVNLPVWPLEIKGHASIDVAQLNASAQGVQGLSLLISLNEGYVRLKELLSPIEQISLQVESDLNDLSIKKLQAEIGQGTVDFQGDIHGLMSSPAYDFKIQTKAVKVQDLIDQSKAPAELEGEVDGQFSGSGKSFDPRLMLQNFKGQGQLALNNAKIEKLNILKTVVGKLYFIPGLGGLVQNALETAMPSNIKTELDTDTTVLDKAEGTVKVENKVMTLQEGQVESKLFSIAAQGTIGFDLKTDIDVKTYLAPDISTALTQAVAPLQGLLDGQNRLYIPGEVSGNFPSVTYKPQTAYITKKVAVSEGSQQLQKVFQKNPQVANILNSVLGNGSSDGLLGKILH